jgi:hypothetical protein
VNKFPCPVAGVLEQWMTEMVGKSFVPFQYSKTSGLHYSSDENDAQHSLLETGIF